MNRQDQSNQNLQNELISEYEAMSQKGTVGFYEETVFLNLVEYYHEAELFGKALEVINHAISQHAYSSTFHKKKAQLLLEKGCATQAIECLDQAALFAPSEFDIVLLRVECLNILGYYNEAHDLLNDLENKNISEQELSEVYLSKAVLYESKQDFEQMYYALQKSILFDITNTIALERIWFSVEMSGCFEESIDLHKQLIDKDPYNYVAWYNLGYSYSAQGMDKEAADAFEYAFIINKHFEFAYRDCAEACIRTGQFQRALNCYQEAMEFLKPDSDVMLNIGFCMESLENFTKAKSIYLKAAQMNPKNDTVYYRLGEIYSKEEKWMSAIAAYNKAMHLDSLKEEFYIALGICHFNIGEWTNADTHFRKAIEMAPEIDECWINYVLFLIETSQVPEAMELIEEALVHSCGMRLNYCKVACLLANGSRGAALDFLHHTLSNNDFKPQDIFEFLPEYTEDKDINDIIALNKPL